ncbi:prepilin-type N-terminal cleavage/methylation domain-containing protein [Clostridium bowmanii]|uniref:prepilin-type N-terminal cleavage/methylation domain-containing protein n=1 Tax=Clostridium bowmanii TaxID=132925 RepID=UPI001C0D2020|nr:prepilin-type N-terminal cleavage/methylation domain-containing protein [Clostridium bowmanii]MBU3189142.1 prepilin-type N-terminal cleavage/methylation domain-containing protein [Clostridium bowmanii]MCA1073028.1 prepilin-type N-terminal cleavage/methylation domain-containing protein [Clostridium bowmanii]
MVKKGVTLIEIVVAMSLVLLMLGVVDSMLISYLKNYKNSVIENKGFNYLNEAISIIEKEVNEDSKDVKTEGNIIKISYSDGSTTNHIKRINSNLYLLYGTIYSVPSDSSYKSLIIDDVKDFVAIKYGKTLYIKVSWYNGQIIERCLAIENAN